MEIEAESISQLASRLARAGSLAETFALYLVASPAARESDELVAAMNARLEGRSLLRIEPYAGRPDVNAPLSHDELTKSVLVPLFQSAPPHSIIVLDLSRMHPRDEPSLWPLPSIWYGNENTPWRHVFERINERRNQLIARAPFLIVLLPPDIETLFASYAPDTWAVRSGVLRVAALRRTWPLRRKPCLLSVLKELLRDFSYETNGLPVGGTEQLIDDTWAEGWASLRDALEEWIPPSDGWFRQEIRNVAITIVDVAEKGWFAAHVPFENMVHAWQRPDGRGWTEEDNWEHHVLLPLASQIAAYGGAYQSAHEWAFEAFQYYWGHWAGGSAHPESVAKAALLAAAASLAFGAMQESWRMTWQCEYQLGITYHHWSSTWQGPMPEGSTWDDRPSDWAVPRDFFEGVADLYANLGDHERSAIFEARAAQIS